MKLYKWSGAGNIFVVLDARGVDAGEYRKADKIRELCSAYGTDGLMLLHEANSGRDFAMEFFNPDGTGGMMCGNGGRCICAFANYLGIAPREAGTYVFDAPDGVHSARILSRDAENRWTVRLRMRDVDGIREMPGGCFLNTGTRHFVTMVSDVEKVNVDKEGRKLRLREDFAPEGTNVDFLAVAPDGLHVRTFEKGVEGETMACGTGITASALAAYHHSIAPASIKSDGRVEYRLQARHDRLSVDFIPKGGDRFEEIYLTGPAELLPLTE